MLPNSSLNRLGKRDPLSAVSSRQRAWNRKGKHLGLKKQRVASHLGYGKTATRMNTACGAEAILSVRVTRTPSPLLTMLSATGTQFGLIRVVVPSMR